MAEINNKDNFHFNNYTIYEQLLGKETTIITKTVDITTQIVAATTIAAKRNVVVSCTMTKKLLNLT